ncbi:hypothetical protein BPOR_0616g00060 [Botrytis porri]|uniref:Uncharacterized protein n=1 Tax=Botrytis porri TaxID=87229 RepID=A0A4Z1KBS3_9HELO|nr:hypothetical protein BPOR_0616g00060 [Botrytis porri]
MSQKCGTHQLITRTHLIYSLLFSSDALTAAIFITLSKVYNNHDPEQKDTCEDFVIRPGKVIFAAPECTGPNNLRSLVYPEEM